MTITMGAKSVGSSSVPYNFCPPELINCRLCPRLVAWRREVSKKKRRSYQNENYWGKPVPGFGDPEANILLLGLAPGAHGSNRTGRMFTGDASGDFLFPALYSAGLASQPQATSKADGMVLKNIFITATLRCVPPQNKPTQNELSTCQKWLGYDLDGLTNLKVILALGKIAHDSYLEYLKVIKGYKVVKKYYPFTHGLLHEFKGGIPLLDSYHVSFQNTNTGKLTVDMFMEVLRQAKSIH